MSLVTRTVSGVLKDADGHLLTNKLIKFTPSGVFGGGGVSVPPVTVSVPTDADDATFSIDLLTSDVSDSFVRYVVKFHDGSVKKFDLVAGSATTLDDLINLFDGTSGASNTQILQDVQSDIEALQTADEQNVKLTGDQSVSGVKAFASSPTVPTPTTGTQAANKDYVDANAGAGVGDYAIEFNGELSRLGTEPGHNVNCGPFWKAGEVYGDFFAQAWVKPFENCGYLPLSAGYGGDHNLLWGFNGATGLWANIQGNVSNETDTGSTSFGASAGLPADNVQINAWSHVAVGCDGTYLYWWLNGALSGRVAKTDGRMTSLGYELALYLGGSDHSNGNGRLKSIAIFENAFPLGAEMPFAPRRGFRASESDGDSNLHKAAFLMDFSNKSLTVQDLSAGFEGSTHPGVLSQGTDTTFAGGAGQSQTLPQWVIDPLEQSDTPLIVPAAPTGALTHDSFSRNDVVYAWQNVLGLGSTEPNGSLGSVAYSGSSNYGILSGKVFSSSYGAGIVNWEVGSAHIVNELGVSGQFTHYATVYVSYTDANNHLKVVLDTNGFMYLRKKVGGVETDLDNYDFGGHTAPYTISLEANNAHTYTVRVNGVARIVYNDTSGNYLTGTKAGFAIDGGNYYCRIDHCTVTPAAVVAVDSTAPTVPVQSAAAVTGSSTATISWAAATDAVGVTRYRYRLNGGSPVIIGNVLSFGLTGLTADNDYTSEVAAGDAAGNWSAYSNAVVFHTDAVSYSMTDTDAAAFVTAAGITNNVQKQALDDLVAGLKTDGLWTKMYAVYPFVGGTAAKHKWNLKNPLDTDGAFRLTFAGGWTHSANGILPDGSTGYANTHLVPSAVMTDDDHAWSLYSGTDLLDASVNFDIGALNGGAGFQAILRTSILGGSQVLSDAIDGTVGAGRATGTVADSLGLFTDTRTSSTSHVVYKNGSAIATSTAADATAMSAVTQPFYIGARNSSGAAASFALRQYRFACFSSGLNPTQAANLYARVQAFQAALSRTA